MMTRLFYKWECIGLPGLPFDEAAPVPAPKPGKLAAKPDNPDDADVIHHGPDCAAFDDGQCLPWRGRATVATVAKEHPCPLAKCGGLCYHYMAKE